MTTDRMHPGVSITARQRRRGAVAVEAALVAPVMIVLMFGVWELGRLIHVKEIVANAAREGARCAAGGAIDGTPVTVATVDNYCRTYMTAAGLPPAAVSGAQVTLQNLSGNTWTDPVDAQPLDQFSVTITIPPGAPFDSLAYSMIHRITSTTSLTAKVVWQSANDKKLTIDTALPY